MEKPISAKLKGYRDGEPYKPDKVLLQPFKVTDIIEPKDGSARKELEDALSRHSNYVLAWPMGGLPDVEEYTLIKGIPNHKGERLELELEGVLEVNGKVYSNFAVDSVKIVERDDGGSTLAYLVNAVRKSIIKTRR